MRPRSGPRQAKRPKERAHSSNTAPTSHINRHALENLCARLPVASSDGDVVAWYAHEGEGGPRLLKSALDDRRWERGTETGTEMETYPYDNRQRATSPASHRYRVRDRFEKESTGPYVHTREGTKVRRREGAKGRTDRMTDWKEGKEGKEEKREKRGREKGEERDMVRISISARDGNGKPRGVEETKEKERKREKTRREREGKARQAKGR